MFVFVKLEVLSPEAVAWPVALASALLQLPPSSHASASDALPDCEPLNPAWESVLVKLSVLVSVLAPTALDRALAAACASLASYGTDVSRLPSWS